MPSSARTTAAERTAGPASTPTRTAARSATARTAGAAPGGHRRHDEPPGSDELFRRMAEADGADRRALRQQLVLAWMPMARRMARRYRDRGEAAEDLQQVAALGLIKAVDGFDLSLGHAFASYAVPTIDGELKRHFRDHTWAVHVPRSVQDKRARVRAAIQQADTGGSGGAPPPADLAARTGLPEDDVRTGLAAMSSYSALSLDAPADGFREETLADLTGGPDPALDTVIDREAARPQLRALPERERTVLFLRFFRDMKQWEIAEVLGVSQMHVSRILSAACHRVRDAVMDDVSAV